MEEWKRSAVTRQGSPVQDSSLASEMHQFPSEGPVRDGDVPPYFDVAALMKRFAKVSFSPGPAADDTSERHEMYCVIAVLLEREYFNSVRDATTKLKRLAVNRNKLGIYRSKWGRGKVGDSGLCC